VNAELPATPERVNEDAYAAWLFRLKPADPAALDKLLDATAYAATIGEA
jgi:glycine cleavage system H protein